jgi:hypothetical protein
VRVVSAVLLLAACGGKPPPPPPPPKPAPHVTRVPVPDDDDADTEPGVTVIDARGHMDPAAVVAGIKPHGAELGECYTTRVAGRRWLGGHVVIHWDIKKDGTISRVRLAQSDLGAWPIEKCLLDIARAATFAKPIGGDADFTLPLDFTAPGGYSAHGSAIDWDDDQALRAVGGQLMELDACAKQVKKPAPRDVAVTVYVGPRGKAQSVGFASDASEIDDKWAECAEKTAMKWRLRDPSLARGHVAKLSIKYRAK